MAVGHTPTHTLHEYMCVTSLFFLLLIHVGSAQHSPSDVRHVVVDECVHWSALLGLCPPHHRPVLPTRLILQHTLPRNDVRGSRS